MQEHECYGFYLSYDKKIILKYFFWAWERKSFVLMRDVKHIIP